MQVLVAELGVHRRGLRARTNGAQAADGVRYTTRVATYTLRATYNDACNIKRMRPETTYPTLRRAAFLSTCATARPRGEGSARLQIREELLEKPRLRRATWSIQRTQS